MVTPFVGVWIEIRFRMFQMLSKYVTPFVGVWIEIILEELLLRSKNVTPFVGVWIEISTVTSKMLATFCHSLRGSVD